MSFFLAWPDPHLMNDAGFGRVQEIPAFYDSSWKYQDEPSKFLRERALCEYRPPNFRASVRVLTLKTVKGFGESICNFLEWCELRRLDWRTLEYDAHIFSGYQTEMSSGRFATHNVGLSPATVNLRVQEACNFLDWAAQRGYRNKFSIPTTFSKVPRGNPLLSHGHIPKSIEVRVGRVRPNPKKLYLPTKQVVERWLECVRIEKGEVKHLMTELIIKTAIRREEAVQWQLDTLPLNKDDWKIVANQVFVTIEYGAKGAKQYNRKGDIVGPSRSILVPLELALRLHTYRETKRLKYFANYVKSAATDAERTARRNKPFQQLFLSEFNGKPISHQTLYDTWTEPTFVPYKGWSPHLGRHYWACMELLTELEKHLAFVKNLDKANVPLDWMRGNVQDAIMLRIQPQLGHIDKKTTDLYIDWVTQYFRGTGLSDEFEAALENNN